MENMADTEGEDGSCETPTKQDDLDDPKDENASPRGKLDRQRSFSTASLVARTKLASLIQITTSAESEGQTDHKKIADTVFDTLVGGTFDLENRFTIQDSGDVLIILELLDHCNESLKVEILGLLIAILRKSVPNLQSATKVGLIERILSRLTSEPEIVAHKLVELLGVLSSYSITVKELKTLLGALKGEQDKWPRHAVKMLKVLKLMLEKHGPDVYFNFTGQDGAAITLPPISKWPLQSGFAFSTWICLDTSHIADATRCKPYLYCFRTGKGLGYSAHFSGPMLVLEAAVKAGKKENKVHTHLVKFDFHPQKWYMVTVVYTYNRFRSSEVRCFVNGKLSSSGELTLVHTNEPFDKCYIGSSPKADVSSVFHGQTAAVYLFSETLAANTIAAIYRLGPGYMGQFKFEAEIDIPLSEQDRKVLYDGHLASTIMFMYSPRACDQQLCMEASPIENASFFCHSPHALMLEGVQAIITHSFQSALHSLGGIQMLLPLFTQLDFIQDENENKPDVTICAVLLSLLSDLLKSSSTSQQQMMQCQGFLVISNILEKAKIGLSEQSLNILLSLARYLLYTPGSGPLLGNLLDHILFKPNLWVKTPAKVQLQLFSVFATDLVNGVGCAAHIRREVGVRRLMYMLKEYYWLEKTIDHIDTGASRPSKEDIKSLRPYLLLLVKQLVLKEHGIAEDELYSILAYLVASKEEENIIDVLQLVLTIMTERPETAVPSLDKVDGFKAIFKFLDASLESIRVYCLKIIGCFIQHCNPRRKVELLQHYGLFSLIGKKLMHHGLTLTTYNVLFEILVGRVSKQILTTRHPEPDDTFIIHNANLCPVIVKMLHQIDEKDGKTNTLTDHSKASSDSTTTTSPSEGLDIKKIFLSDLVLLLHHSKENRSILLQLSCWQDWLFSLSYIEPNDKVEQRTTDTVFSLFRMLLHHAFQEEREGWRIWVDTLAILHGKVSQYAKEKNEKEEKAQKSKKSKSDATRVRRSGLARTKSASEVELTKRRPLSPESDNERKKFFQSLLHSKSSDGDTIGAIPEEMESAEETGHVKSSDGDTIGAIPEEMESAEETGHVKSPDGDTIGAIPEEKESAEETGHVKHSVGTSQENVENGSGHAEDHVDMTSEIVEKENDVSQIDKPTLTLPSEKQREKDSTALDGKGTQSQQSDEQQIEEKRNGEPSNVERIGDDTGNVSSREGKREEKDANNLKNNVLKGEDTSETTDLPTSEQTSEEKDNKISKDEEALTFEKSFKNTELDKSSTDVGSNDQSTSEHSDRGDFELHSKGTTGVEPTLRGNDVAGTETKAVPGHPVRVDTTNDKNNEDSKELSEDLAKQSTEKGQLHSEYTDQDHEQGVGTTTEHSPNEVVADSEEQHQVEQHSRPSESRESISQSNNIKNGDKLPTSNNDNVKVESISSKAQVASNGEVTKTVSTQDKVPQSHELLAKREAKDQDNNLSLNMKSSFIGADTSTTPEEEKPKTKTENPENVENTATAQSSESASESSGPSAQTSPTKHDGSTTPAPEGSQYRAYVNIPEFMWSTMHQRLLGDLLFAIESDLQVWRSHTRKSVMDFVNAKENTTYLWNLAHFVSVLADNVIHACGDLLPLLSSVTSRDYSQDVIQPCGGMSLESSFSFLNRLMSLVDVIVFTSSLAFSGVESNRNMSSGGFLRQCLRLVFCCAARNRLVCRQRNRPIFPLAKDGKVTKKTLKETREAIKALISSTEPPTDKDMLQNIPGHITTVTDPEKLLQEMDVNRLRAVVYRDFEDSRQAQFLALTVVYFIAVMMVAKYRDLLKHDESRGRCSTVPHEAPVDSHDAANGIDEMRSRAVTWGGQRSRSQEVDDDVFASLAGEEPKLTIPSIPKTSVDSSRLSLSEKVEVGFKSCGSLLKEILLDFSPFLSRVLVGSHAQELVYEGLSCQKSDSSVELVMLLCSQEWQNSLQRHGGAAFMELINEGRLLSHAMRERIVVTTSEAYVIMTKLEDLLKTKHFQYEELCGLTGELFEESEDIQSRILVASRRRDSCVAKGLLTKVQDKLTCEQGAWAPEEAPEEVSFYRLDNREDDSRKRRCLVKNQYGSSHPEATLIRAIEDTEQPIGDSKQTLNFAKISSSEIEDSYSLDDEDSISDITIDDRILDVDDTGHVLLTTDCQMLAPCVVVPGSLTITSTAMFFSADEDDEEYRKIDPKILQYVDGLNGKWLVDQIKAIFSRRYLLQNCAVEIFFGSGTSTMFKLSDQQTVKKVIRALPPVGVGTYYGITQTRAASLYSPKQLFQKSTMTARWQRGEIDNFQYLMFLNTIAGRTYCDLNQYPVFPWVITNYESPTIDLKDPSNYRDLSKPVGTLNPNRHSQFLERYASWDENDDIPPFHYGTHYSTLGFTLAWLIRLEPFATQFLNLQGGKFDHPGRTFCSIGKAWKNCQRDTSDVKELIPELFYLPEMLLNENRFTFGVDDDGTVIDDVELPPWATSPYQFITIHKAALESDYVSAHLHEWIDLIFGFKQRGPEAVKATNVFFHLTYEGSVDLDAISDPVMREAVQQQIKSFGQTPSQLLLEPHPVRASADLQVRPTQEPFKSIYLTFKVTENVPVTYVAAHTDMNLMCPAVVTISCNQCFSINRWMNTDSQQSLRGAQIEQDPMLATPAGRFRRQLGEPLDQTVTPSASCFVVTNDNRTIMACGYWDNSFKCFSSESGKLTQCVFGHRDLVTCLAYNFHVGLMGGYGIVVSGSRDATVLVWHWNERYQRVTAANRSTDQSPSPLAILTGHEHPITCVDVNASLGLVVSGSQEGPCLVHTVTGDRLHVLYGPQECIRPRLVRVIPSGLIVVSYSDNTGHIAVFTINGCMLESRRLDDYILALAVNRDGTFLLAGGFSRYLTVWRANDLALIHTYPPCDGSIRALAVSSDQKCLVAGLASGSILAIATDFTRWSIN